jgi:hypothetical protein
MQAEGWKNKQQKSMKLQVKHQSDNSVVSVPREKT